MTIQELLTEKGFVENVDYSLIDNQLLAIVKYRIIEATEDEQGNQIPESQIPYNENIPSLDSLMRECLLRDGKGAYLVSKYLDQQPIKPSGDINVDLFLMNGEGWRITNIIAPSIEYLYGLIDTVSPSIAQEQLNIESKAYLAETDWYIIREFETGKPCPTDIKSKREQMRLQYKGN